MVTNVTGEFRFRKTDLWHLIPAMLALLYWWLTYWQLSLEAKSQFIRSGGLGEPFNALVIPLVSDIIQLAYLLAPQRKLTAYGLTLRNWFSRIDDRKILWTRHVLSIWVVVFATHLIFTLSALSALSVNLFGRSPALRLVIDFLNVSHFLLVNALFYLAVISQFVDHAPAVTSQEKEKYASSGQSATERFSLFNKAGKEMD